MNNNDIFQNKVFEIILNQKDLMLDKCIKTFDAKKNTLYILIQLTNTQPL